MSSARIVHDIAAPTPDANAILVWRFEDAPEHLRVLSRNGGDEDWLAYIPADQHLMDWGPPAWMQSAAFSTDGDVQQIDLGHGVVVIGAHS